MKTRNLLLTLVIMFVLPGAGSFAGTKHEQRRY